MNRPVSSAFPVTRWSVVAAVAAGGDRAAARTALDELCRLYWQPLYGFARRKGFGPEDAEDATQGFLLEVLETEFLSNADPVLGRLRSFLLNAFSRHLMDIRRDAGRQKRGGGIEFIPLDFAEAEDRYLAAPAGPDAALQFESDWATALLESSLAKLEAAYVATDRAEIFAALRPWIGAGGETTDQAALAGKLGMSHAALRQSLLRLRERFRRTLREQIADTLRDPSDSAIDEELRALRAVVTASR